MLQTSSYLGIYIFIQQCTECRLVQIVAGAERPVDVVEPGEDGVGQGGDEADDPDEADDSDGPLEARHGVGVERVADSQVTLHREGDDRQHRGVGGPGMTYKVKGGSVE